jgi:hypothetical protein
LSAPQHETLTNNSGLLNHPSSIVHPLLYVLLLLFDDSTASPTAPRSKPEPENDAVLVTTKGGAGE